MIYLDTSVAIAHLLAEDQRPSDNFWQGSIISSRLLDYEIRTVLGMRTKNRALEEAATILIGRIALIELVPEILSRVRERFPTPVRTLDALHLASAAFLLDEGVPLKLATYDRRMIEAARKMKIPVHDPVNL